MQWIISGQVKVTSLILLQTSRSFLTYLEKKAKIGEDNVTLLENLCQHIVPKLMEKLDKYKREVISLCLLACLHQTMGILKSIGHV